MANPVEKTEDFFAMLIILGVVGALIWIAWKTNGFSAPVIADQVKSGLGYAGSGVTQWVDGLWQSIKDSIDESILGVGNHDDDEAKLLPSPQEIAEAQAQISANPALALSEQQLSQNTLAAQNWVDLFNANPGSALQQAGIF